MTNWKKLDGWPRRCLGAVLLAAGVIGAMASPTASFITARDGKLYEGAKEFRFLSFNIPNLLEIEDNVGFTNQNPWRLPDDFEINDALQTLRQLGGTVTRTYVITVRRTNDAPEIPRHVLAPGVFSEPCFQTLDAVLAAAQRAGVRVILPLVDNWPWMGGRAEYARWRGKAPDDFWTDPQVIADFKQTIQFILTRTNTITGTVYREDPTILAWETGNELASPIAWTREIARYLKSLDAKHLVLDGFNAAVLRPESLEIPEVDLVTTHHYPGNPKPLAELIWANAATARGKKPYFVGEFGFFPTAEMVAAAAAIEQSGASGGLLWSLRFRNRDGGFYWHSEPEGGNVFKAFHWPASPMGQAYDEAKLMAVVRTRAYALQAEAAPEAPGPLPPNLSTTSGARAYELHEETAPAVPVPLPPRLLPFADPAAIAWQGSVGALTYQVERAAAPAGPWRVVGESVDEAFTQYRPQFADEEVPAGIWYYQVRARNRAGLSAPSNVMGPVSAASATLVDELADFSKVRRRTGQWELQTRDCRPAREDAHRAAGLAGSALIYQVGSPIEHLRVFALCRDAASELKFSVSPDGNEFRPVPATSENYFRGAGDYGYWQPILFQAGTLPRATYVKLELTGAMQLGRVEIVHQALRP